jgi:neutral ceramidase
MSETQAPTRLSPPHLLILIHLQSRSLGAFCESPGQPFDGMPCQANTSTCGGTVEQCHGRGPGFTLDSFGFHSNQMIAQVQVTAAKTILGSTLAPVTGSVRSVHIYLDMCVGTSCAYT